MSIIDRVRVLVEEGSITKSGLARAAGLVVEPDVDDSTERGSRAVSVRFSLPRGAYATVVLRALGQ